MKPEAIANLFLITSLGFGEKDVLSDKEMTPEYTVSIFG